MIWRAIQRGLAMPRVRSPNYPAISLPEAITRAKTIHEAAQHLAAPKEVIAKHLGFGGLNGGSNRIISALTKYGLLEEVSGDKVKVSPLAISILHPTNPAEKASAIKEAASKPPLFSEITSEWNGAQPSDANLRAYLIRRNFAADALDRVILAYKDTVELVTSPENAYNKPASNVDRPPAAVKVGDHIQWEQGGVLRLPQARRVTWVSDDGRWLRIEGSPTGIPMDEACVVEPPRGPTPDLFQSEMDHLMGPIGPAPLTQRLKVMMTGTSRLRVNADLIHPGEVDKLIKILEANKALLEEDNNAKDTNAAVAATAASDE
jgi:hypothetical protein